ncbi:hypothetical protein CPB83DRAFT_890167 [Crepidotus variabilis]|uniref:Uncharacterized protein n=1 Tax=Crepidotus variabilis TaxID=179855 RepID=A0A9P6JV84_9AGAR|nr:hypothetical protein CPB83DRAFT_890167 [Crepidotus variabilis]
MDPDTERAWKRIEQLAEIKTNFLLARLRIAVLAVAENEVLSSQAKESGILAELASWSALIGINLRPTYLLQDVLRGFWEKDLSFGQDHRILLQLYFDLFAEQSIGAQIETINDADPKGQYCWWKCGIESDVASGVDIEMGIHSDPTYPTPEILHGQFVALLQRYILLDRYPLSGTAPGLRDFEDIRAGFYSEPVSERSSNAEHVNVSDASHRQTSKSLVLPNEVIDISTDEEDFTSSGGQEPTKPIRNRPKQGAQGKHKKSDMLKQNARGQDDDDEMEISDPHPKPPMSQESTGLTYPKPSGSKKPTKSSFVGPNRKVASVADKASADRSVNPEEPPGMFFRDDANALNATTYAEFLSFFMVGLVGQGRLCWKCERKVTAQSDHVVSREKIRRTLITVAGISKLVHGLVHKHQRDLAASCALRDGCAALLKRELRINHSHPLFSLPKDRPISPATSAPPSSSSESVSAEGSDDGDNDSFGSASTGIHDRSLDGHLDSDGEPIIHTRTAAGIGRL